MEEKNITDPHYKNVEHHENFISMYQNRKKNKNKLISTTKYWKIITWQLNLKHQNKENN